MIDQPVDAGGKTTGWTTIPVPIQFFSVWCQHSYCPGLQMAAHAPCAHTLRWKPIGQIAGDTACAVVAQRTRSMSDPLLATYRCSERPFHGGREAISLIVVQSLWALI